MFVIRWTGNVGILVFFGVSACPQARNQWGLGYSLNLSASDKPKDPKTNVQKLIVEEIEYGDCGCF